MIAIPALDLSDGAPSGSLNRRGATRSFDLARAMADLGFRHLHVIARGTSNSTSAQFARVEEIVRDTNAAVQVAGAESISEIEQLFRAGVDHVIVGSRALDEPEWLAGVADLYPGEIAVATDVRDRRVVRRGWVRTLPVDILDIVDELNAFPLHELLIALPTLDGTDSRDLPLLEDVAEQSRFPVVVAGGVSSVEDLRALEHRGIAAAVIDADRFLSGEMDGRRVAQEFGA